MKIQEFTVKGDPVPQGRPRFFRLGQGVGAFDPPNSRAWKESVAWQVKAQKPRLITGALRLCLYFELRRPKRVLKGQTYHVTRPDVDNLAKAVKDALTGILYRDDCQVVSLVVDKTYTDKEPCVKILAQELK